MIKKRTVIGVKFFLLLLFFGKNCLAQKVVGIAFESELTWKQITEKARKEDKYIFVDCYTTWCAPCKQMAEGVFTHKRVGDFFNENFINVAVQIDRTSKDSQIVKKWYQEAQRIEKEYAIASYPTYLFLDADGELVHVIKGGNDNIDGFIAEASKALHKETQYINMQKSFEKGSRDTVFLKKLIGAARSVYDFKRLPEYIQAYLKIQSNLQTKQNIELISQSLSSSKDVGYSIFLNYPAKVDSIIGKDSRIKIINDIVFDEEIVPVLRKGGKKEITSSGMITYVGQINHEVDWDSIKNTISSKYPEQAAIMMINTKTAYYRWLKDWKNLNLSLWEYYNGNAQVDLSLIDTWAQYFISFCEDYQNLNYALKWAVGLRNADDNAGYAKRYEALFAKANRK
ncbi:thioredoxin family protein [Pedobacter sp.]|uniref:thioredoxin family protein n=1 Tax=Pedobacter sp. TaxID=1411316 RepID=UPI0031DAC96E